MCCFLSPLEYVLFTLMSCFTVHLNTTSPIWLTLLLLWFIWDYIMPSNLVCIHVVIVLLVATPPGSMDKFVIRKATSQGTKRAIADSQDSSDSDSELQPPEKVVATESGRVWAYKDKLSYMIIL